MRDQCRITLVQLTEHDDPESVMRRMPAFFEQAVAYGSDLIAFPEYCLGRRITLDDPRVALFFDLAKEHNLYAVAGLIESVGDRWQTTALLSDRNGNLIDRYLKTHPAAGIAPYWWPPVEGDDAEARGNLGDSFKTFALDFGTIGILQCYDGCFPESWGCTSFAGAEIIVWINGRSSMVQDAYCITAAQCYGCVVAANVSDGYNTGFAEPATARCVTVDNAPADTPREESRLYPRIPNRGDAAIHATIDLKALRAQRKHLRHQHQRRPDLYGPLTKDAEMWKAYPEVPWVHPDCEKVANKAKL